VSLREYIATTKDAQDIHDDFRELLEIIDNIPQAQIKKVTSHYVVFKATESEADLISHQTRDKYVISPNTELGLLN
jgi:hypothetical protein